VAETGTVRVTENMSIERYSHVMHIVSTWKEPCARTGCDGGAAREFSGGHGIGRAQGARHGIIDELEPVKRGIYSGAVGYLGFHGDMDLAIALRTALIKDRILHMQAGAGIVADSDRPPNGRRR